MKGSFLVGRPKDAYHFRASKKRLHSKSIRKFAEEVGVTKRDSIIDVVRLENFPRDELNKSSNRVMAVLDPLKVVITNFPEGETESLDAINNPENLNEGSRKIPFSRNLHRKE